MCLFMCSIRLSSPSVKLSSCVSLSPTYLLNKLLVILVHIYLNNGSFFEICKVFISNLVIVIPSGITSPSWSMLVKVTKVKKSINWNVEIKTFVVTPLCTFRCSVLNHLTNVHIIVIDCVGEGFPLYLYY